MFFSCNENIDGCTDIEACNYNPDANVSVNSCEYEDCNNECGGSAFLDECGQCNDGDLPCGGCTDSEACNYDPSTTIDDGSCIYSNSTEDWSIQMVASMNPWTVLDPISDENNILGVSQNSLDEYDSTDTPEPPHAPGNWISGYFYHPEWDSIFGDKFTQDYKSNEFCDIKEWNFIVEANSSGPMELLFILNNVPDSLEIELIYDDSLALSDSLIINFMLEENAPQEFLIKVGIN